MDSSASEEHISTLVETIDEFKEKISDYEYLRVVNILQALYNNQDIFNAKYYLDNAKLVLYYAKHERKVIESENEKAKQILRDIETLKLHNKKINEETLQIKKDIQAERHLHKIDQFMYMNRSRKRY